MKKIIVIVVVVVILAVAGYWWWSTRSVGDVEYVLDEAEVSIDEDGAFDLEDFELTEEEVLGEEGVLQE